MKCDQPRWANLTRRNVLRGSGAALTGAVVAGCDVLSTEPGQDADSGGANDATEAPDLARLVESGDLPPLEDRLPDNPVQVEPIDREGVYGGAWSTMLEGPSDVSWLNYTVGYEYLVRWRPNTLEFSAADVIPNIAQSIDFDDDGRTYTFKLRPGMRWSDGAPFTADDIQFAYEDVLLNDELYPEGPSAYLYGGDEPAKFERVDEYTVTFHFVEPNGLFLEKIAADGWALTTFPRHYFEKFHPDYNSDIDQVLQEEGRADWIELFQSKGGAYDTRWEIPDLPTLHGWVPTTALAEGSRVVFDRNPYYWKIDPSGRQLPYLDRVVFDIINDYEVMMTRTMNGDVDMHSRHFNTPQNKPALAGERESGGYQFFDISTALMNTVVIALNLNHEDPVKREIFNNVDFRIGLSQAIDRQEIIDAVYQRQGEPYQAAPRPESELYDEEMAKQYTTFDPDLANETLDRAGYAERNPDGIRLGPDGAPITFAVDFATGGEQYANVLEMVEGYWREVGVDVNVQPLERSLFYARKGDNDFDANVWSGDGGLELALDPRWYLPCTGESNFALRWAAWFTTDGVEGEEPPERVRQQMQLYREVLATTDTEQRERLLGQLLVIAKEEFFTIGISLAPDQYGIVRNDFHNVPPSIMGSAYFITPAPSNPSQYFID